MDPVSENLNLKSLQKWNSLKKGVTDRSDKKYRLWIKRDLHYKYLHPYLLVLLLKGTIYNFKTMYNLNRCKMR